MINIRDREERKNAFKTFTIGGTFIMCLWVLFPFLVHTYIDPLFGLYHFRPMRWLGGCVCLAGYLLAVSCVLLFIKEGKGTPLPFAHPKRLVMSGPYKFVRNPMVLGTVFFLFGTALALGSSGILTYTFLLFLIMHFFVLVEEKSLGRRFGSAYAMYLRSTPRWWPTLRRG